MDFDTLIDQVASSSRIQVERNPWKEDRYQALISQCQTTAIQFKELMTRIPSYVVLHHCELLIWSYFQEVVLAVLILDPRRPPPGSLLERAWLKLQLALSDLLLPCTTYKNMLHNEGQHFRLMLDVFQGSKDVSVESLSHTIQTHNKNVKDYEFCESQRLKEEVIAGIMAMDAGRSLESRKVGPTGIGANWELQARLALLQIADSLQIVLKYLHSATDLNANSLDRRLAIDHATQVTGEFFRKMKHGNLWSEELYLVIKNAGIPVDEISTISERFSHPNYLLAKRRLRLWQSSGLEKFYDEILRKDIKVILRHLRYILFKDVQLEIVGAITNTAEARSGLEACQDLQELKAVVREMDAELIDKSLASYHILSWENQASTLTLKRNLKENPKKPAKSSEFQGVLSMLSILKPGTSHQLPNFDLLDDDFIIGVFISSLFDCVLSPGTLDKILKLEMPKDKEIRFEVHVQPILSEQETLYFDMSPEKRSVFNNGNLNLGKQLYSIAHGNKVGICTLLKQGYYGHHAVSHKPKIELPKDLQSAFTRGLLYFDHNCETIRDFFELLTNAKVPLTLFSEVYKEYIGHQATKFSGTSPGLLSSEPEFTIGEDTDPRLWTSLVSSSIGGFLPSLGLGWGNGESESKSKSTGTSSSPDTFGKFISEQNEKTESDEIARIVNYLFPEDKDSEPVKMNREALEASYVDRKLQGLELHIKMRLQQLKMVLLPDLLVPEEISQEVQEGHQENIVNKFLKNFTVQAAMEMLIHDLSDCMTIVSSLCHIPEPEPFLQKFILGKEMTTPIWPTRNYVSQTGLVYTTQEEATTFVTSAFQFIEKGLPVIEVAKKWRELKVSETLATGIPTFDEFIQNFSDFKKFSYWREILGTIFDNFTLHTQKPGSPLVFSLENRFGPLPQLKKNLCHAEILDAIWRDDLSTLKYLQKSVCHDISAFKPPNFTILHHSVLRESPLVFKDLIWRVGEAVNAVDKNNVTATHLAAFLGSQSFAESLLQAGAHKDVRTAGGNLLPYTLAECGKHTKLAWRLKIYEESSSNMQKIEEEGSPSVGMGEGQCETGLVNEKMLFPHPQLESPDTTPEDSIDTDVGTTDIAPELGISTTLHDAIYNGNPDLFQSHTRLRQYDSGICMMAMTSPHHADAHGFSPVHYVAVSYKCLNRVKVLDWLLNHYTNHGADMTAVDTLLSIRDSHGNTLLHLAVQYKRLSLVKRLLGKVNLEQTDFKHQLHANIFSMNDENWLPIHFIAANAADENDAELLVFLVNATPELKHYSFAPTPVQVAASNLSICALRVFLKHGFYFGTPPTEEGNIKTLFHEVIENVRNSDSDAVKCLQFLLKTRRDNRRLLQEPHCPQLLQLAIRNRVPNLLETILQEDGHVLEDVGGRADENSYFPLHDLARHKSDDPIAAECAQRLLDLKYHKNQLVQIAKFLAVRDSQGHTALDLCCEMKNECMAKLFLLATYGHDQTPLLELHHWLDPNILRKLYASIPRAMLPILDLAEVYRLQSVVAITQGQQQPRQSRGRGAGPNNSTGQGGGRIISTPVTQGDQGPSSRPPGRGLSPNATQQQQHDRTNAYPVITGVGENNEPLDDDNLDEMLENRAEAEQDEVLSRPHVIAFVQSRWKEFEPWAYFGAAFQFSLIVAYVVTTAYCDCEDDDDHEKEGIGCCNILGTVLAMLTILGALILLTKEVFQVRTIMIAQRTQIARSTGNPNVNVQTVMREIIANTHLQNWYNLIQIGFAIMAIIAMGRALGSVRHGLWIIYIVGLLLGLWVAILQMRRLPACGVYMNILTKVVKRTLWLLFYFATPTFFVFVQILRILLPPEVGEDPCTTEPSTATANTTTAGPATLHTLDYGGLIVKLFAMFIGELTFDELIKETDPLSRSWRYYLTLAAFAIFAFIATIVLFNLLLAFAVDITRGMKDRAIAALSREQWNQIHFWKAYQKMLENLHGYWTWCSSGTHHVNEHVNNVNTDNQHLAVTNVPDGVGLPQRQVEGQDQDQEEIEMDDLSDPNASLLQNTSQPVNRALPV